MVGGVTEVAEVDGRRLRREQNREAVLDALLAMFEDGHYTPTTNEIAERAGISPRSLFRYFDDVDDLGRAAIERHLASAAPLLELEVDVRAPLADRIDAVVAARVRLWSAIEPTARAARFAALRNPLMATTLRSMRAMFRDQLRRAFAPELRTGGGPVLAAIDALCSFESYDLLRNDQRLSRGNVTDAITSALRALLGGVR
jgi:AcrR family transcriptional regulator